MASEAPSSDVIDLTGFDSDPDERPEQPPKKKAKRTVAAASPETGMGHGDSKKARRVRGKLRKLQDMPLDILYEIFGHLDPIDVLHLSRTVKALRSIVLHRSASGVWVSALARMDGVPECPPDLSLPAYARLLWDKRCHSCAKSCQQEPIWIYRVRLCNPCFHQEFSVCTMARSSIFMPDAHDLKWLPEEVFPAIPHFHYKYKKNRLRSFVSMSRAKLVATRALKLTRDGKDEEKKGYIQEQESLLADQYRHAKACAAWYTEEARERCMRQRDARARRAADIYSRLRDLGWAEEIRFLNVQNDGRLADHPLVSQSRKLTARVWDNIREELIGLMQKTRPRRIRAERIELLKQRLNVVKAYFASDPDCKSFATLMPSVADACTMTPIRRLIENTPSEQEITKQALLNAAQQAIPLVEVWYLSRKLEVAALLPRSGSKDTPVLIDVELDKEPGPSADDALRLDLASTFFCRRDASYHSAQFPQMLSSPHGYGREAPTDKSSHWEMAIYRALLFPWSWQESDWMYDACTSRYATNIMRQCGLDERAVTTSEMEGLVGRLSCSVCNDATFNGWTQAVFHLANSPLIGALTIRIRAGDA